MARALVDTGAIVALFNRQDPHHASVAGWFRDFRGQLLSTDAVITETAYVLAANPGLQNAALLWVERARKASLLAVEPVEDYAALARILGRYADLPCDYADASLIALAERTGTLAVATIDQRDFSIYRIRGRRRFRIVPAG